jgi:DNA-binding transcriptional ArsR family regulator
MDDMDRRLCRLAMEVQYSCQKFFFGEMAHNYFEDQNKEFIQRRRTSRYDECFRKLPDEFKTKQFEEVFGVSQQTASRSIKRLRQDGVVEAISYGLYKKVVSELP